jgi:membrane protein
VGSIIVMLSSVAIIAGPWILKLVARFTSIDTIDEELLHAARYGFTLVLLAALVIALHIVLPNSRLTIRQILPGALTTTIAWIVAASILSIYFGEFANYSATYGSLAGVAITLLFFYISAIIFIFGGELNAALLPHRQKLGPPPNRELKPLPLKT